MKQLKLIFLLLMGLGVWTVQAQPSPGGGGLNSTQVVAIVKSNTLTLPQTTNLVKNVVAIDYTHVFTNELNPNTFYYSNVVTTTFNTNAILAVGFDLSKYNHTNWLNTTSFAHPAYTNSSDPTVKWYFSPTEGTAGDWIANTVFDFTGDANWDYENSSTDITNNSWGAVNAGSAGTVSYPVFTTTTNRQLFLTRNLPEVLVFTNNGGYFIYNGLTYYTSNSITTGLAEAYAALQGGNGMGSQGGKIILGAGDFTITTPITFANVIIEGQGMIVSGITYRGVDASAIGNNGSMITVNGTYSGAHDLYFSSQTNTANILADFSPLPGRLNVHDCWFGYWHDMTNGCNGFNPDTCAINTRTNNLIVRVNATGSDVCSFDRNSFSPGVIGLSYISDHIDIKDNEFDGCGEPGLSVTNLWPTNSPYALGAVITFPAQINGNMECNIFGNHFVGGEYAYAFITGTSTSHSFITYNDGVNEMLSSPPLVIVQTNSSGNVNFTMVNPNASVIGKNIPANTGNFVTAIKTTAPVGLVDGGFNISGIKFPIILATNSMPANTVTPLVSFSLTTPDGRTFKVLGFTNTLP